MLSPGEAMNRVDESHAAYRLAVMEYSLRVEEEILAEAARKSAVANRVLLGTVPIGKNEREHEYAVLVECHAEVDRETTAKVQLNRAKTALDIAKMGIQGAEIYAQLVLANQMGNFNERNQ